MTETATKPLTIDNLLAEVRSLAMESPTNKYNRPPKKECDVFTACCEYNRGTCDNGSEGCIFGQAFRRLGVEVTKVLPINNLMREFFGEHPQMIKDWCWKLQHCQDTGKTWSEALSLADETYPLPAAS
jgi:hypothetical protein